MVRLARHAGTRTRCRAPAGWRPRDRVALLIGNNQYATSPLRNAANDAKTSRTP